MAIMIAKITVFKKPPISNLLPIRKSVKESIRTVIKKETRPKVIKLIGNVSNLKIEPIVPLTKPIINPVIIAHIKLSTCASGVK